MVKLFKALSTVSGFAIVTAFENDKPGWKLDADGKIEMKDGHPVFIDASGREMVVDGNTISNLNKEAKTHREGKEQAEGELNKYKVNGKLIDPEKAAKAIETVSKLDAKQLIDAGEVDKVKETIKAEFTGQLTERDGVIAKQQATIDNMLIDKVFDGSEFLAENLAMPRDFFQSNMRQNFKVEDGKVTAYDPTGNRLMSKKRVGEHASPEEALQLLIEMHPQKDTILKAPSHGGSGNGGGGGGRGNSRYISRADFEKLAPHDQAAKALEMQKGDLQMTD